MEDRRAFALDATIITAFGSIVSLSRADLLRGSCHCSS
jgi:hypothetical protein